MQRRTRNRICIWLITGGLLNLLVYTVIYAVLGGDAKNGGAERIIDFDGEKKVVYYLSGHYIRGTGGESRQVTQGVWIYSFIHSISIWPTQAGIIIAMILLARPHIIATMRESNVIRGPTFITIVITLTVVIYSAITTWFIVQFIENLLHPPS